MKKTLNEKNLQEIVSKVVKKSLTLMKEDSFGDSPCISIIHSPYNNNAYYKFFNSQEEAYEHKKYEEDHSGNSIPEIRIIPLSEEQLNSFRIVKNFFDENKIYGDTRMLFKQIN